MAMHHNGWIIIINLDDNTNIHNTDAKRREANDLNFTYL
jgi:hypothetical protein